MLFPALEAQKTRIPCQKEEPIDPAKAKMPYCKCDVKTDSPEMLIWCFLSFFKNKWNTFKQPFIQRRRKKKHFESFSDLEKKQHLSCKYEICHCYCIAMQAGFRSLTSRCSSFVIYVNWNLADCGAVKIPCISSCIHRFLFNCCYHQNNFFCTAILVKSTKKNIAPADMKHRWRGDFIMRSCCTVTREKEKKIYSRVQRSIKLHLCVECRICRANFGLGKGGGVLFAAKGLTWGYDRGTGNIFESNFLNKLSKKHDSYTLLSQNVMTICFCTLLVLNIELKQLRLTEAWTLQFFYYYYHYSRSLVGDQTCFFSTSYECWSDLEILEVGVTPFSTFLTPWAMCAV